MTEDGWPAFARRAGYSVATVNAAIASGELFNPNLPDTPGNFDF